MNVYSAEEMYSKLSRFFGDNKSGKKRIAIKPLTLTLPRNWTKVLRLGPACKVSLEDMFEVMKIFFDVCAKLYDYFYLLTWEKPLKVTAHYFAEKNYTFLFEKFYEPIYGTKFFPKKLVVKLFFSSVISIPNYFIYD